jgi:hypothetical protein
MDAEDWLKGVEKKLVIAQCMDREKVLFAAHQLYGTTANWWDTYCNTHVNIDAITWNEFKARFCTHYVPRGTMKLKKKEFADLKQGGMTVNECHIPKFSFRNVNHFSHKELKFSKKNSFILTKSDFYFVFKMSS